MNKLRSGIVFLACAAFSLALAVDVLPGRKVHLGEVEQEADSATKVDPTSAPARAPSDGFSQGCQLVTDVVDCFGGAMESENYRIAVNSGGQPSAVGVSQSDSFVVKAGFVHASYVMRGDANADGVIDLGDVVYILNYLFKGGPAPDPLAAGDANCDGLVDLGDVVYLLNYLFKAGPPPPC